jgi:hypothetical protein
MAQVWCQVTRGTLLCHHCTSYSFLLKWNIHLQSLCYSSFWLLSISEGAHNGDTLETKKNPSSKLLHVWWSPHPPTKKVRGIILRSEPLFVLRFCKLFLQQLMWPKGRYGGGHWRCINWCDRREGKDDWCSLLECVMFMRVHRRDIFRSHHLYIHLF